MTTATRPLLRAYLYIVPTSGVHHLRVSQDQFKDETLKEKLHRMGSPARWDPDTWTWDCPLTAAAVVYLSRVAEDSNVDVEWDSALKDFANAQMAVEKYEQQVRLSIEKLMRSNEELPDFPTNTYVPNQAGQIVHKPPLRHQKVAYHWALRVTGLMLAHDPGLGKTKSGCDAVGGWYRENIIRPMVQRWSPQHGRWVTDGGVLITCPQGMMRTWADELRLWQGATGVEIAGNTRRIKEFKAGQIAHAHICNYESLDVVKGNTYDAVIGDEFHFCANRSDRTLNVLELTANCKRKLGLTGTPISNNLESIFYQMLILDGGRSLGVNKTAFLEKYFTTEVVGKGQRKNTPKLNALQEISAAMARCTYFLKKEEALDLPPQIHTPMFLPMNPEQERYYKKMRDDSIAYIQDSSVTVDQAAARMMKLRQICQGHVLDDNGKVLEFNSIKVDTLMERLATKFFGRKTVVWMSFKHEINRLCASLQQQGVGYVRLDGDVTKTQRDAGLRLWNHDPRVTVLVGQIKVGIGITLHAGECEVPCFDCEYLSFDHSFTNWKQSRDRIHRIGQVYPCNYTYYICEGSVDHAIYKALLSKESTANAVHKFGKDFFLSLLRDDTPSLAAVA